MKVVVVGIHEAKTNFSKLLKRVEAGDEVIVNNFCKPVARIVPFRASASVRKPGALAGKITIKPGFDDLPPDPEVSTPASSCDGALTIPSPSARRTRGKSPRNAGAASSTRPATSSTGSAKAGSPSSQSSSSMPY